MIVLITYDIASDHRREAISTRLSGCGARVQFSIFECDLKDEAELMSLLESLEDLIDQCRRPNSGLHVVDNWAWRRSFTH